MGPEEVRCSTGVPEDIGEDGEIGETREVSPPMSLTVGFSGVERDKFDFEEPGRIVLGKAEYDTRFGPLRFFGLMITVPVELVEDNDVSESLDTMA